MVHVPPNLILQAESDIVHLLQNSPVMPQTILVRPFEESLLESGRVFSNDNILVKFTGIDTDSTVESVDEIVHKWKVSFELMCILRDLRGHHPAYQLIETIMMLLTNYNVLTSSTSIAPRSAKYTEYDENKFRYWSISLDYEVEPCSPTYMDPYEPVPPELRCVDSDCQWTGFNENGDINVCWRRYKKPGEDKYRHYNSCSQNPGDEVRNIYFGTEYGETGPRSPEFTHDGKPIYGGRNPALIPSPPQRTVFFPGFGDVTILGRIPLPPVEVNLGIYRNTPETGFYPIATRADEIKVGELKVDTGAEIISTTKSCSSCGV